MTRRVVSHRPLAQGLALTAALCLAGASPAVAQGTGGAGAGQPVPLLPPSVDSGTLDPTQGELVRPGTPGFDAPPSTAESMSGQASDLGPPREVGPPPGASTVPMTGDPALPPPEAPPMPETGPAVMTSQAGSGAVSHGSTAPADAEVMARARGALADATTAVYDLRWTSGFTDGLNDLLSRARAVVVIPSFFKAGFFVGGAYGSALLLVRDEAGAFSDPAFLTLTAGSLGFQFGAQDNRVLLLIMTDDGLRAILDDGFKMEAGASVTFGIGGGVSTGSTTDVNHDIIAFSHSKGLFGGGGLEGSVFEPRHDWNAAFYTTPGITPSQIVLERRVSNPESRPLIESLTAAAPPQ
ncbi:lipid-binding SYLF domain-containing protein [Rhodospira trueperi]|uniref:Lipid-binding SYLF domain-containing protein n=1 Tax=Rhodospira trueperi TaxID=69960 RepID=A0A1G7CKZ3_9PROT|nr:lipid-binding SYLF domain-containing protein [Rhodospira trueperi]SDE39336.1 Lipid-binding SYLF domain-containing protein [Rhodospira trueperi]